MGFWKNFWQKGLSATAAKVRWADTTRPGYAPQLRAGLKGGATAPAPGAAEFSVPTLRILPPTQASAEASKKHAAPEPSATPEASASAGATSASGAAEDQFSETRMQENKLSAGNASEARMSESRMLAKKSGDRMLDSKMPEGGMLEDRASDSRMPEGRTSDSRMPEGKIPEGKASLRRNRLARACALLAEGLSEHAARDALAEEFALAPAQAERDLDQAFSELERLLQLRASSARLSLAVRQRDEILRQSLEKKDFRTALAAADSREKLLGLGRDSAAEAAPSTLLELARLAREEEEEAMQGKAEG